MTRLSLVIAAASVALLSSTASAAGYYSAKPATAPAKASLITGDVMWKCTNGLCVAPKTTSRDAIVCEQVAKRVGTLASFAANGAAFDDAALAKCNTRAK